MEVDWTVTTPSVTAAPDGPESNAKEPLPHARQPDLPKRAGVPPATTWSVQPEQSLAFFAVFRQGATDWTVATLLRASPSWQERPGAGPLERPADG